LSASIVRFRTLTQIAPLRLTRYIAGSSNSWRTSVGLLALARSSESHCPKCKTKPIADQHELTEAEIGNLSGPAAQKVRAKGGRAFECGVCSAIYSYRHGFSTFICYG